MIKGEAIYSDLEEITYMKAMTFSQIID